MAMKITATDISNLLTRKYAEKFVCVPECKVGSAWMMRTCPVIDLWCMAKSWTNARTLGFEIKISRNDFLRDHKWPDYLKYCTEFYFVAPPGIIDPSEVPEQAGLLISSKNAKMLYTKKKAPVRDVDIPDSIYRYILMWRARILIENRYEPDKTQYWKNWLATKDEKKELGYNVSRRIRDLISDRILSVEAENKRLISENERLQHIQRILSSLGIDRPIPAYSAERQIKETLDEINTGISENFLNLIKTSARQLFRASEIIEKKVCLQPPFSGESGPSRSTKSRSESCRPGDDPGLPKS